MGAKVVMCFYCAFVCVYLTGEISKLIISRCFERSKSNLLLIQSKTDSFEIIKTQPRSPIFNYVITHS